MVDGIFVYDFRGQSESEGADAGDGQDRRGVFQRYDAKLHRPPAGHASSITLATWALFTEVLPESERSRLPELREIALKLDLPKGGLVNGSGIKFTNNDWATQPKDAGQNLRASIGVWQWQKSGNNQVFPKNLATHERHGPTP